MTAKPKPTLHVWLPALPAVAPLHSFRDFLFRADRLPDGRAGYLSGLGDYFSYADGSSVTEHLPAAAITREYVAGDAALHAWLAVDPAWVQPEMNGARLLACGQLQVTMAEATAIAETLRASFDEAGMVLEVSTPDRWHVRLPPNISLPTFAAPEQALGEDFSQHIPQGAEGRRWRVLLNDIQVLLHQHPLNAERRARGLAPINSVWLWGGGPLPAPLQSRLIGVISDDLLLMAMATQAGLKTAARTPEAIANATNGWLIDLQDLPMSEIESQWWPILQPLLQKQPVQWHFASAERWHSKPWHRWRVWRRPRR